MKNKITIGVICLIMALGLLGYYVKKSKYGPNNSINTIKKSDNVSKKDFKDISDKEILDTVNNAYKLYSEIYYAIDRNDYINLNIPSAFSGINGGDFYRALEPYEKPYKREKALKEYFIENKILSEMLTSKSKHGLHKFIKRGKNYYFSIYQLPPHICTKYDEVTNRIEEDNALKVTLKGDFIGEPLYNDVKLVFDENKLKIAPREDINYKESVKTKEYTELENNILKDIKDTFSDIKGNYSVAFYDLAGNEKVSINNYKAPSASTIKIYIMIEAFRQAKEGQLSLEEEIVLNDRDKAGGSGVLVNKPSGVKLKIENLVQLMMMQSDNTAANILIDRLGMENINNTIKSLGCIDTELNRKMMDTNAIERGDDNYTSVEDLCSTFSKMYNGNCIDSSYDPKMINIMKQHQFKSKIPNGLPKDVVVAHKAGEMIGIENDAGIIYTDKGAYILCILTQKGENNKQVDSIKQISKQIYGKYIDNK
jgi:beta-lactamase class A